MITFLLLVGTLVFFLVAWLSFAKPDAMWSWQKRHNDWEGQVSQRTDAWETQNAIGGCLSLVVGIGFLIAFISSLAGDWDEPGNASTRTPTQDPRVRAARQTALAATMLPRWGLDQATQTPTVTTTTSTENPAVTDPTPTPVGNG